jgi:hypothetical protein
VNDMQMKTAPKFLLNVSMDVSEDHEALLNAVYDDEHVPELLGVPGVFAIRRYRRQPFSIARGATIYTPTFEHEPRYTALYEIASPDVLTSAAWADAVDRGRWAQDVRPYTRNRRHTLHELIGLSK